MSWPVGYANPNVSYWTSPDGALFADGVQVTEEGGWIDVAAPSGVLERGGPSTVLVRLRADRDEPNGTMLFIDEVVPREHDGANEREGAGRESLTQLVSVEGEYWLELVPAVHRELASRVAIGRALSQPSRRAVRPPAVSTGQAWDTAVVSREGVRKTR